MGDLSAFKPSESPTVSALYEQARKRGETGGPRNYLGASIIGHECDRYLWLAFRQCVVKTFDGRMHRLLHTGHLFEARIFDELRGIGCKVECIDPNTNDQFAVSDIGGHFKGHLDGVVLGLPEASKTWHVAEAKTHNEKSYEKLVSVGVKIAKPMHHAQMMVYMGQTKTERAVYIAVNKNTDGLYTERVNFDSAQYKAIMLRAERIIRAQLPLDRCATRPDDFRCKTCEVYDLCWGTGSVAVPIPFKGCRTCCHATPEMDGDGRWSCAAKVDPMKPCAKHLLIPGLVLFAEVTDAGQDWIEFKNNKDGAVWRHGADLEAGQWMTEELMTTPGPVVGSKPVQAVKDVFGGAVSGVETPAALIDRYPPTDSERRWDGPADSEAIERLMKGALMVDELPEPTAFEDCDTHTAVEYAGRFLVVIYKAEKHAAIWEGKQ